jgi:hypothetical protein
VADTNKKGALDIRELLGNIIFWLKGSLENKFTMFFEIFSSVNNELYVDAQNICKTISDALHIFKETFFIAKVACDKINTGLDGRITYDEFKAFCKVNPSAIDLFCRLTLGPYPPSEEYHEELDSFGHSAKAINNG